MKPLPDPTREQADKFRILTEAPKEVQRLANVRGLGKLLRGVSEHGWEAFTFEQGRIEVVRGRDGKKAREEWKEREQALCSLQRWTAERLLSESALRAE